MTIQTKHIQRYGQIQRGNFRGKILIEIDSLGKGQQSNLFFEKRRDVYLCFVIEEVLVLLVRVQISEREIRL